MNHRSRAMLLVVSGAVGLAVASSAFGAEVKQVSAGGLHTCALQRSGNVSCWGDNFHQQASAPEGEFRSISAGANHTCGLRPGAIECWGHNNGLPPGGEFRSIDDGDAHGCGVRRSGKVACWGNSGNGRATPPHGEFRSVSGGFKHTCGVRPNGRVACWGEGPGQAEVPGGDFRSVSAGFDFTCGVRMSGRLACWGYDDSGQVSKAPKGRFRSVSAGGSHACGVKRDRRVRCWGDDAYQQAEPPWHQLRSVSAGSRHTCALTAGGHVACWGWNDYGQIDVPAELARTTNPSEVAKIDRICERVNDWLADHNFPERLDCLTVPDVESACEVINGFFRDSNVPAHYHCHSGELAVSPAGPGAARVDAGLLERSKLAEVTWQRGSAGGVIDGNAGGYLGCPGNRLPLTGGAAWHAPGQGPAPGKPGLRLSASAPLSDQSWYAHGIDFQGSAGFLTASARCVGATRLREAKTVRRTFEPTFPGSSDFQGKAACPRRQRVIAGGALFHPPGSDPDPQFALDTHLGASVPLGSGRGWFANGQATTSAGRVLTVVAICMARERVAPIKVLKRTFPLPSPSSSADVGGSLDCPGKRRALAGGAYVHEPGEPLKGLGNRSSYGELTGSAGLGEEADSWYATGARFATGAVPPLEFTAVAHCIK